MAGPRFDEIEGEEVATAPSFDAIDGDGEAAPAAPPSQPKPTPAPRKGGGIWAALKAAGEASGLVPHGLIPEERTARGAVASILQGPAMQWADEAAGWVAARDAAISNLRKPRGEQVNPDWARRNGRDRFRAVEADFRGEHPAMAFALTASAGALSNPISIEGKGTPLVGAGLRYLMSPSEAAKYLPAAVQGAINGAGATEEAEGMGEAAAIGAPLGVAGQAVGDALGDVVGLGAQSVAGAAGRRVAAAGSKADELAAAKVAAEIASAKGKLGAVTQEANRALENLLRLEGAGALSSEQAAVLANLRQTGVLPALEHKLADAMLEQVPGAAGRVDMSRAALEGLTSDAPRATSEAAEEILSGAEAKRQIGERAKRYLPTIIGAAAGADGKGALGGAMAGYALGGTPGSALIGGLSGSALRPALRAGARMVQHPAVQRAIFAPAEAGADAAGSAAMSALPPAAAAAERTWRAGVERGDHQSTSVVVENLAMNNPEALGPYAQQIQQAAAAGNLPLVHYTLQQKDPQYRAMLERARAGETE